MSSSTYGGFPAHDPRVSSSECGCWSCSNGRLVAAEGVRNREARRKALDNAADMVVSYIRKAAGGDIYGLEHGTVRVEGTLAQIFRDISPFERILIDAFEAIPLLERYELLVKARERGSVRVRDMKFSKEAEEAEKAEKAKREAVR